MSPRIQHVDFGRIRALGLKIGPVLRLDPGFFGSFSGIRGIGEIGRRAKYRKEVRSGFASSIGKTIRRAAGPSTLPGSRARRRGL